MQKESKSKDKMFDTIYDFYIPFSEVSFWTKVCDYANQMKQDIFLESERNREAQEFLSNFATDIEMYEEFGNTLEKFRFLFNYFELFVLCHVLTEMKRENVNCPEEEIVHYIEFLLRTIRKNPMLNDLLKQKMRI
ncbi:hypothetical protein [Virgibacillus halodenitrificans]|uniref:hypothetical protein n=1 Tax=Virgibacillus halodenitrificans TaxID=1482 RepID=UPI0013CF3325|nr:hypothetical protein [Virgibacillus halodenitrificans]